MNGKDMLLFQDLKDIVVPKHWGHFHVQAYFLSTFYCWIKKKEFVKN